MPAIHVCGNFNLNTIRDYEIFQTILSDRLVNVMELFDQNYINLDNYFSNSLIKKIQRKFYV